MAKPILKSERAEWDVVDLDLPDHIHVLRILHGARDLPAILKDE